MAAVITGGTGGLASAIVEGLSGTMTVFAPPRSEMDVRSESSVEAYFSEIGSVDLLVCNAGKTFDAVLLKMSEGDWDDAIEVNLRGAFLCAKAAAKKMIKAKVGHIIFVGSYSGYRPPVGQANYASAKAALEGLTKSLAQELGGRGIRVNCVVPGWMQTAMTEDVDDTRREQVKGDHCLKMFNTPAAVAAFIRTLHLDMPYTSGQTFHLDSRIIT